MSKSMLSHMTFEICLKGHTYLLDAVSHWGAGQPRTSDFGVPTLVSVGHSVVSACMSLFCNDAREYVWHEPRIFPSILTERACRQAGNDTRAFTNECQRSKDQPCGAGHSSGCVALSTWRPPYARGQTSVDRRSGASRSVPGKPESFRQQTARDTKRAPVLRKRRMLDLWTECTGMEDMSEYTAKFNQAWRTMSEYKTEWVWPPLLKLPLLPAEPSKQNVAELHECVCVCPCVCL